MSPEIAIWAVCSPFRMSDFSVISSTPRHYLLLRMLNPMLTRTLVGGLSLVRSQFEGFTNIQERHL